MNISRVPAFFIVTMLIALGIACSSGSGSDTDADLTEESNNARVGREVNRCAVDEFDAAAVAAVNEFFSNTQQQRSIDSSRARSAPGSITVPTVVHVISSGESVAEGNISDNTIAEQMRVLNETFTGVRDGRATPFFFSLIEVTRTVDPELAVLELGSAAERRAKSLLRQGGAETLNIYVAGSSSGTLGYASFPWDYPTDPVGDGVVIASETVPGGSLPPYNEGDTLVHEVGHWLGLFHSFQGGCGTINDDIDDTPAEQRPAFGCPIGRDTCQGDALSDPVTNYMDYSDDFCLAEFSDQQILRMDDFFVTFRGS